MYEVEVPPLDFVARGDGPGVVLIHGTGADALSNWGPLIDSLAERNRVVAPNLPGAGATSASAVPLEIQGLAEQVLDAVGSAGVSGSFDLVGHSLGAVIAAAVAAVEPSRVRSLLLHGPWVTSGPRERLKFELLGRLLVVDPPLLARALVLDLMSPGLLAGIGQGGLDEMVRGFEAGLDPAIAGQLDLDARVDLSAFLGRIDAPTLVLASSEDQLIPTHHQRAVTAAIPGAIYSEIAGGHGVPFEDPVAFCGEVERWLADRGSTR